MFWEGPGGPRLEGDAWETPWVQLALQVTREPWEALVGAGRLQGRGGSPGWGPGRGAVQVLRRSGFWVWFGKAATFPPYLH